ncbi:MAG: prolyl oligopeptidase family serine peptidase [Myxococcota bacterium]|nr:prolyl oligopeptidase family serine peptidase [Myxococcota bacterium]
MKRIVLLALCLVGTSAIAQPTAPPRPAPSRAPGTYAGLGAESIAKEDIARFTAPALDPRVSRRIQAMLDVRGAGNGQITARGDRMYFTTAVTGTPQVWRQDGPMKFAIQQTGGEDRTTLVDIAPNERFVVVTRDYGGEENPGLYLMAPDGGALQVIQHTPKVQTFFEYITDDSKQLYFRANDVDPASFAIYRHDVASGKRERVFDAPGLWSIADHRGDTWLLKKALGSTQHEIYQYDLRTRQLTPLLGQGEAEEYAVAFGARPGEILVRTNKRGDHQRVYAFAKGTLTPITPELPHDIRSFSIDRQRTRIYYSINEAGYLRLAALDARTLRPLALPKLPAADNVSLTAVSRNGRFVQLAVDGATLAPRSLVFDWQTRKLTTWRVPMTPEIDPTTFAPVTLEHYPARDGTRIPMFVRRPRTCAAPCPVVVSFHGGPEGQSTAGFSGAAQLFVEAGFVYVEPNVRGSLGYGKRWQHADDGPKRLAVLSDIEDVARFIRTSWSKDGKAPKIGVTGGSYGGYATLMAMTYFAGAYDAGVQRVGISNFLTFLGNTAAYRRALRTSEYGDPTTDKVALTQLSPITHVAKIRAPLLSIQGVNDPRVPVGEAVQIYRELERRRIPGGLILFPDEGHSIAKRSNQVIAMGHTIAFFEQHLLGK